MLLKCSRQSRVSCGEKPLGFDSSHECCVWSAAAPRMFVLWMVVFISIGLIWAVTNLGERLRKKEEQVNMATSCDSSTVR